MKLKNKKLFALGLLCILCSSSLVFAQSGNGNFNYPNAQSEFQKQEMKQTQNRFQERYNFTCEGNCTQKQVGELDRLEVRMQKRFLFWGVESLDVYDINNDGELVRARHNFWSRLLNRNKVRA